MNVTDKIRGANPSQNANETASTSVEAQKKAAQRSALEGKSSGEAVEVSSDFGSGNSIDRKQKVEDLKAQYQNGTYKPDSQAVAAAFLKEVSYLS